MLRILHLAMISWENVKSRSIERERKRLRLGRGLLSSPTKTANFPAACMADVWLTTQKFTKIFK